MRNDKPASAAEVKLLRIMLPFSRDGKAMSAHWIATLMWPDARRVVWGSRSALWQKAGAMLHRLEEKKLVMNVGRSGQNLWLLLSAGTALAGKETS